MRKRRMVAAVAALGLTMTGVVSTPAHAAGLYDLRLDFTNTSAEYRPYAGDEASATASIVNLGPSTSEPATLTINLDRASVSVTAPAGCTQAGLTLTCAVGALAPSERVDFEAKAHYVSEAVFRTSATLDAPNDANNNNNFSSTAFDYQLTCNTIGTPGDDVITTNDPTKVVCGLGGNDTITLRKGGVANGGGGNDTLIGSADIVDYDGLYGSTGNDTLRTRAGNYHDLDGGTGDDIIEGGPGTDQLSYMRLALGGVNVDLRAGTATGAGGNDTITRVDNLRGTRYDDSLQGGNTPSRIDGDEGNDIITGLAGDDVLQGYGGNDTINGGPGNDYVEGGRDDDTLIGGNGNDIVSGGSGNDTLSGNADDDVLFDGQGNDSLNGGAGIDTVNLEGVISGANVSLKTGTATSTDFNATLSGFERLVGGAYDDVLEGAAAGNFIDGSQGNDTITGLAGTDQLFGGEGNDALYGNGADDQLTGGEGDDSLFGGQGVDTLTDDAGTNAFDGGTGTPDTCTGTGTRVRCEQ